MATEGVTESLRWRGTERICERAKKKKERKGNTVTSEAGADFWGRQQSRMSENRQICSGFIILNCNPMHSEVRPFTLMI